MLPGSAARGGMEAAAAEQQQQLRSVRAAGRDGSGWAGVGCGRPGSARPGPARLGSGDADGPCDRAGRCFAAAGLPAGVQPHDRALLPPLRLRSRLPAAVAARGERGPGRGAPACGGEGTGREGTR